MPIQFNSENGGKRLVIHANGMLTKSDYEYFIPEVDRLIQQHGALQVLFDMTDFHGWEASAMWEDIKFGIEHFADIDRLAIVGENKWQHAMATLSKPFTKAAIHYFDHTNATGARQWLGES
jgi:hypothetical protein